MVEIGAVFDVKFKWIAVTECPICGKEEVYIQSAMTAECLNCHAEFHVGRGYGGLKKLVLLKPPGVFPEEEEYTEIEDIPNEEENPE